MIPQIKLNYKLFVVLDAVKIINDDNSKEILETLLLRFLRIKFITHIFTKYSLIIYQEIYLIFPTYHSLYI